MKTFSYIIKEEEGIHARPAGLLFKEAGRYASEILIHAGPKSARAVDLMDVMDLGGRCGQTVTVEITGEDEEAAYEGIKGFFETYL